MAGKAWIRVTVVSAAVASLAGGARAWAGPQAVGADTQPAATQTTMPATTRGIGQLNVEGYVEQLSKALQEGLPAARFEAAQRLVAVASAGDRAGSTLARTAIGSALAGDDRAQTAAARAVAEAGTPDRAWIAPLKRMLSRDRVTAEYAARALGRMDEEPGAYQALIEAARSKQPGQIGAIRAMGRVVQKPVAEALVGLVGDASQGLDVREAVSEALVRLSGQTAGAEEPSTWARWWNARQGLDDKAWRVQVVTERHQGLEADDQRSTQRLGELRKSVGEYLLHQYEAAPAARKSELILEFLNDADPDFRASGAAIVPEAVNGTVTLKSEVKSRLVYLLSDASPEVRLQVAVAVGTLRLSDQNALDAIVMQLKFEPDVRVKKALIQTLANMDIRAVPVLEELLRDPSEAVAGAAADGLKTMAPTVSNNGQNPKALAPLFGKLLAVLHERTGPNGQPRPGPSAADLRARLVGALAATMDKGAAGEMVDLFSAFIQQAEPPAVRQAAMQGLGAAGDLAGPTIATQLSPNVEPDADVRRAAATALGMINSFLWAGRLEESTRPQIEQNPAVREAAWRAFQQVIQSKNGGGYRELDGFAAGFRRRGDHEHEVVVRKAACKVLEGIPGQAESLAMQRQTVGDVYLDDLKLPLDAIPFFRDSLAYFEAQDIRKPKLMRSLLQAYLASRQYSQGIAFARDEIRRSGGNVEDLFPAIADVAETLKDSKDPAMWELARGLISQASTLELEQQQKDRLNMILKEIKPAPATQPVR